MLEESITGGPLDGLKVEFGHDTFGRLEEIRPQPYTGIAMEYVLGVN